MSTDVNVSEKVQTALAILQGSGVRCGQEYRHYKTGKVYRVVAIGLFEGSLEPVVHYQSTNTNTDDQDQVLWTRPLQGFCGVVPKEGTLVPRFARID